MRVGATVRHEPSHRTADFVWEVEPTTTLGDVVDHAAARLGVRDDVRRHVAVDGRYVDPGSTVADAAFVDGSVISFGSPPSIPAPPDDLPTVRIIGGPGAGTIFVLDPGIAVIGSGGGATIVLDDPHVPPLAAALTFDGAGRFVIEPAVGPDHDLVTGSRTDGLTDVLVDRRRITTATPVDDDSVITIGGTLLAVTSRGGLWPPRPSPTTGASSTTPGHRASCPTSPRRRSATRRNRSRPLDGRSPSSPPSRLSSWPSSWCRSSTAWGSSPSASCRRSS
nr:hypothetical protein GCM10025699_66530 [Microbacterium flavescens]